METQELHRGRLIDHIQLVVRDLAASRRFYEAVLDALKIPRGGFTPVFAAARIAGWTAHAIEQRRNGRLLRPASAYIGAMPA